MRFQMDPDAVRLEHFHQRVCHLSSQPLLHREALRKQMYQPRQLGDAHDVGVGAVAHVALPVDGQR
jgi:hypothetical protein